MKNKTKIIYGIIAIIIIAGIIVTLTAKLNFELRYQDSERVELYITKKFEISDIKQITNEIFPNQEVIIQKVEIYEDSVSIIAKEISEEQKTQLVEKINEKYELDLSSEEIEIKNIPHERGRDIAKPYVMPIIIASIIVLVYMAIRYYKLGSIIIILKTILVSVVAQAVLLSLIAITRIPIGRWTMPVSLAVYTLTLIGITTKFEKQLEEKNNTEEE